jgi:DNA-binding transcriptional MerR regulator
MQRGHRHEGTEGTLCRITYAEIARLSGLSPKTVRRYAWNRVYDPHDLDSVLRFIATHRAKRGLTPLGTTT